MVVGRGSCLGNLRQNQCLLTGVDCGRGDEYIAGGNAHLYSHEGGGAAALGGIQPQPLPHGVDRTLDRTRIEAAVKPDDPHFTRTRLLCLENTFGGTVIEPEYLEAATAVAHKHGLATHLDGARLFNAAVAGGGDPYHGARKIAECFDSVSVCSARAWEHRWAPVLLGSREFVGEARRWRKVLGGGLRQAGVLAAPASYALDHHVERLAEDHANAALFAEALDGVPGLEVAAARTNMVFARAIAGVTPQDLVGRLAARGVLCTGGPQFRFAFHLDVSREDAERAAIVVRETPAGCTA
ncbi:GntG family PLP-dependent aldolase [Streptomyces barringtoniae]|uniref:GntG family PLP-dependent aldolase n=1 Tax=Streptomyces barringtoniae TaxID=2892029 RepID=UPI001E654AB8|nr:GntG family PLP-dependent aldolase [Streptomyces barringtoniae]MCC5476395.1 beta-eliminating lyase-related protein [Streptomyces barringtoniae]